MTDDKSLRVWAYRLGKRLVRAVRNPGSPKRADNAFATHLPILIGMGRLVKVRKVVEFGCGPYSTPLFLNRLAFPYLQSLQSYENDAHWLSQIAALAGNDPRLTLTPVHGPMSSVIDQVEFQGADLVFVDDSHSVAQRALTIRAVGSHCHPLNLVIIHDYEQEAYREAARMFAHSFSFTAMSPQTGIVWNEAQIEVVRLRKLNRLIRRHSRRVKAEDVDYWLEIAEP